MNVRNGILIENPRARLKVERVNAYNKQRDSKQFDVYVEMQHRTEKDWTVVTPFEEHYIRALEQEGYKIIKNFEIRRIGG